MRNAKRVVVATVLVACLVLALASLATGAPSAQTDIIVPVGPSTNIQSLYRSFDNGAWEAQVVSLAPFDNVTGAALVMDVAHHEVHEGEMFHSEYTKASVNDTTSVDLLLTTSAKDSHIVFDVFAGGQATIYLYEAPTASGGTGIVKYNMNRTSALTATMAISHTPTVTATGSLALVNGRILPGGTSSNTRVGGGVRQGVEWILAPNTKYLLRATNTSGSTVAINVVTEWYEETP